MKYPFEASIEDLISNTDDFIIPVFSSLESEFLTMPKGKGFVDYSQFEIGYETLKHASMEFSEWNTERIYNVACEKPITLIVLRTMLGFTPPEWGYLASQKAETLISQSFVRSLDRSIRLNPSIPLRCNEVKKRRIIALIDIACHYLSNPVSKVSDDILHRLDKADTSDGVHSLQTVSRIGIPYAMLLYERFMGRPFAGHRDSVSELIGDSMESVIEELLVCAGISYRKTKRAEHIPGFDQAPDFIIPSEFNPQIVIEAKITEDDGTARDKVTRIQHLAEISISGELPEFEVIACIAGRGFGVRREDMKKLIIATKGKVFTFKTLNRMIEYTRLNEFKTT